MTTTSQDESRPQLDVCVVIPTRGRPQLVKRAVRSALSQTLPPAEVVVVVDGPDEVTEAALEDLADPRLQVLVKERSGGAAAARNTGVRATHCSWIAFLDDDDEWVPEKLAAQQAQLLGAADRETTVFATGVEWRVDQSSFRYPLRKIEPNESVGDYLFVRTRPGEGMLAVPSLMLPRQLALAHPLPEFLRTHEEYDWFLDLQTAGITFSVLLEPLTIVHAPSARTSVSSQATWHSSLSWALRRRNDLGERAFAAFCLTDVARAARNSGGPRTFVAIAAMALTARPSPFELVRFLLSWLVPQRTRWRFSSQRVRM